jgi:hypothetical protein
VYDATGQRQDLLAMREVQPTARMEHAVALGAEQRVPVRLLAVRVPQEVADARRRQMREAAQTKGHQVSATQLALAAWARFVTNGPRDHVPVAAALGLGCTRWHIVRLVKLWKSQGRVDASRSPKPWRILCAVYAKRLALLVQPWVFLVSCGAYPDRSLTKAAQTVQKHVLHMASAFASLQRLGEAIRTITSCLAVGCRMNRRKKPPNPYQLLLGATGP